MVTAFLDESGTDVNSVCTTVAGFYGDEDQWRIFRDLWKPHSEGFHALECSRHFPKLSEVIEASKIHGVFITIWKADYKAYATEHMKSFIGNAYAVCALLCAMQICEEAKNVSMSFVYEQGQPNFDFVKRIIDAMMESHEFRIDSVIGAKKADFIELHAADFVSHCASTYDKPPLQRLFDSGLLKHAHITGALLKSTGPMITAIVRQAKRERLRAKGKDSAE